MENNATPNGPKQESLIKVLAGQRDQAMDAVARLNALVLDLQEENTRLLSLVNAPKKNDQP